MKARHQTNRKTYTTTPQVSWIQTHCIGRPAWWGPWVCLLDSGSDCCWKFGRWYYHEEFFCCQVASVVSDSVRPHRPQPTRLPRPWASPDKNTRVSCHFLLQSTKVKIEREVAQSCLHGLQPNRLLHPWDFPGKSTGEGCHFLLQSWRISGSFSVCFVPQISFRTPCDINTRNMLSEDWCSCWAANSLSAVSVSWNRLQNYYWGTILL